MRWYYSALLGAATLGALWTAAEAAWPASRLAPGEEGREPRFPAVIASNLEGRRYELPRAFDGEKNLVLIAFTQEQQADVDTWLAGIKPLLNTPGFEAYELPTVGKGTPAFRGWLDGVMRAGIPDKKQRERTITSYLDKPAFRRALALPDERRIYSLLVDRTGKVLWRAQGRYAEEHGKALRTALAAPAPAAGEP